MRRLNYELVGMCNHNRDGSFARQANRKGNLQNTANALYELGFRHLSGQGLKPKHIKSLVKHWKGKKLSIGRIKNLMSDLRWWSEKINKAGMISKDNSDYGIGRRSFVPEVSKAIHLTKGDLSKITNPWVKASLLMQREFGLRREEAMKIQPWMADHGGKLILKDTWCKGGRPREIYIEDPRQREVLDNVKAFVLSNGGRGSLIPSEKTYKQHMRTFERQTRNAGINKTHGLRHMYAQLIYEKGVRTNAEIFSKQGQDVRPGGWKCPVNGGPHVKDLTKDEKVIDRRIRGIISSLLGHGRLEVANSYLGS